MAARPPATAIAPSRVRCSTVLSTGVRFGRKLSARRPRYGPWKRSKRPAVLPTTTASTCWTAPQWPPRRLTITAKTLHDIPNGVAMKGPSAPLRRPGGPAVPGQSATIVTLPLPVE